MAKTGLMGGQGINTLFSRGPGGILPERGSQAQLDMVGALMQSAMSGAQNSGSPLLALLAPLISGAVGSRTQGLYDAAQKERTAGYNDKLLALMGDNPRAASVLDILGDPNAPDHVRSLASSLLGSGRGGRGGGAGKSGLGFDPRQVNVASGQLNKAVADLVAQGLTRGDAIAELRNDPLYAPQFALVDRARAAATAAAPKVNPGQVPVTPLAAPAVNTTPPPPPKGTVEF